MVPLHELIFCGRVKNLSWQTSVLYSGLVIWQKAYCGHHIYPMANTIFENSTTQLKYWFHAVYIMSSTRCGISAKQLQRETGVTYKTAWRMFHKIREMLYQQPEKQEGIFEADETYIGAKHSGKVGRGSENKAIVFGIMERDGKLVAKKISNVKSSTLIPLIKENAIPNAIIISSMFYLMLTSASRPS